MNVSFLHRIWISLITISPCTMGGITMGFSSIALPEMNLSLDASSWFSCLFTIAAPFGSITSGYVIDKFGRKPTLVLSVIPGMIGWLLIATHENSALLQLFVGRFCTGVSAGASFFPGQVYLADFIDLDPNLVPYRSAFTNAIPASTYFGYFLVITLGAFFPYRIVAWVAFILAICIFTTIATVLPESPVWLYEKGRYGDAEWCQKRLKLTCSFENYPLGSTNKGAQSSILARLKRRDVYVPLFITSVFNSLIYLCGSAILGSYLVNLLDPDGLYSLQDAYNLSAIAATLSFVSSLLLLFCIPRIGIRKIAIGSSLGIMVSMLTYGIADYFTTSQYANFVHYVSIGAIWLAQFCNGFGFLTIPRAILGEVFPPDAKGFAAVPAILMYIVTTIVVKVHPYLAISLQGLVYIVYAFFGLIQVIFLYYFLPETVGRTVNQINNDYYDKRTSL